MVLIIDNYDSFTYNLVDLVRKFTPVRVSRNDEIGLEDIACLSPSGILISPGPGRPQDSGISMAATQHFMGQIPILGVCLGHQIIGELLGMKLVHAARPMHGKTSDITHLGKGLFEDLPQPLRVMRYHSLILDGTRKDNSLEITARTLDQEIMGLSHSGLRLEGVQFHPESILSVGGETIIHNWVKSIWS